MRYLSSLFGSRASQSIPAKTKRSRRLLVESLEGREMFAINIVFNYDLDDSGFFTTGAGAQARAVLDVVGRTLGERLDTKLAAIQPTGANSWIASFQNPFGGPDAFQISDLTVRSNTLVVAVVGGNSLSNEDVVSGFTGQGAAGVGSSAAFQNIVESRGRAPGDFSTWGGGLAFDTSVAWNFSVTTGPGSTEFDFLTNAFRGMFQVLGFNAGNDFFTRYYDTALAAFVGPAAEQANGGALPQLASSTANPLNSLTPTELDAYWSPGVRYKYSAALGNDLPLMSAPFQLEQDAITGDFVIDPITGNFTLVRDPATGSPINTFQGTRVLPTSIDYAALEDIGWNLAKWPTAAGDNVDRAYQINRPNTIQSSGAKGVAGTNGASGFTFNTGLFRYERAIDVEFFRVDIDLAATSGLPQTLSMSLRPTSTNPGLTASFRVFSDDGNGNVDPVVGVAGEQLAQGTSFTYQFTTSGTYYIGVSRSGNIYYDATDLDLIDNADTAPFSRALVVAPTTGSYTISGFLGAAHNYSALIVGAVDNPDSAKAFDGSLIGFGRTLAGQIVVTRQPNAADLGFFWTNQTLPSVIARSFDAETSGARLAIASVNNSNRLEIRVYSNANSLGSQSPVFLPLTVTQLAGARNVKVVNRPDGTFQVFYVGADNALYSLREQGANGPWSGRTLVASNVAAYTTAQDLLGVIEVLAVARGTGVLSCSRETAPGSGVFSAAKTVGAGGSQVVALFAPSGQLIVATLGFDGVASVRTRNTPTGAFSTAVRLTTLPKANQLAIALNQNGFAKLFAAGKDGNVYTATQTSAAWTNTQIDNLQGKTQTGGVKQINVIGRDDGRIQLFSIGNDRTLTSRIQGEPDGRFFS